MGPDARRVVVMSVVVRGRYDDAAMQRAFDPKCALNVPRRAISFRSCLAETAYLQAKGD